MALANQRIKTAWIMAVISGTVTLIFSVMALQGNTFGGVISAWNFIDVVIAYGLAFGIFKKSRVAAVIMLIYFIIGQVMIMAAMKRPPSFLAFIFVYGFFEGIRGTFAYHTLKKSQDSLPSEDALPPQDEEDV